MHRSNRVALIGASVRAAAQSAARAGLEVIGIDRFGDQDTLQACRSHLPIGSAGTGKDLQASEIRDRITTIAETMPIVPVGGLAGEDRAWLKSDAILRPWPTQKAAMRQVRAIGLLQRIVVGTTFRVPPTFSISTLSNSGPPAEPSRGSARISTRPARSSVPPTDRSQFNLPATTTWLRKEADACGGLGTRWLEINSQPSARSSEVMQQWVEGRPFGATFLSNGSDSVLLGVCRSLHSRKGALPFVYSGSLGPVACSAATRESLREIGQQLVAATHLRGLFNIDYIEQPGGSLWLLEINPRWSGSSELIECHLRRINRETSLMNHMLDGLHGDPIDHAIASNATISEGDCVYLKRVVFARRDIRFNLARIAGELDDRDRLHDLPADGQLVRSGEPICTLIQRIGVNEKDPMRRHRVTVNIVSNHRLTG